MAASTTEMLVATTISVDMEAAGASDTEVIAWPW